MGLRAARTEKQEHPPRFGRVPRRRPGGDSPELISHRYHTMRVTVTLITIGAITMVIGLAALIDPNNHQPIPYFAGCVIVGAVTGAMLLFVRLKRPESTSAIEIAMLTGLAATFANTIYGGLLDVDPWWQVCSYLVVIMIAGGVSLRRWSTFCVYIAAALTTWVVVIESSVDSRDFIFDSYVLMILGAVTAGAILLMFKSERRRVTLLNEELMATATHDQLTGILNRNGLLHLAAEYKRGRREHDTAWAAYIDVDFFKTINDRYGHDLGDEVLEKVATALTEGGVPGDLIARWGGDEFVVVGFDVAPSENTLERIVNSEIQKVEGTATVSVGVSRREPDETVGLAELLKRADQRMYRRRALARRVPEPEPA
ncbi:MAG TPA: GGDEF domain-containing protein [Solirubrobacterales bacterium]|nr:GGDEF domain-containing protein [Solirubrobacterales bacterium]